MERRQFVPEAIWVERDDGYLGPLRRADDPERWMELCEADEPVITQVDDGHPEKGRGLWPTSSSSAPSIMAAMMDALDVVGAMSVLEIGTGTGYNAALLAERVGPANVVTVEVDPAVADHARRALGAAGFPVTVVTGDGTEEYAAGAPYDRVLVTAAAHWIPYTWVGQTRPGGRTVVPWASPFHGGDTLLALTVAADGTATGTFGAQTAFMPLRGQRLCPVTWVGSDYDETTTRLHPHEPFDPGDFDAGVALGTMFPGCGRVASLEEVTAMAEPAVGWPPHTAEAWTEADLDAMPDDGNKYEVLDGRLIVTPPPRETHQGIADAIAAALRAAAPPGWRVRREIGVRLASGDVIPDVTVLRPDAPRGEVWTDVSYVALVVEVASEATEDYDRGEKSPAYARAGIPSYWRAVPGDAAVCLETAVERGRYARVVTVVRGETHTVAEPFETTVDPAHLLDPEN